MLRMVLETMFQVLATYHYFTDYATSFDSINRAIFWQVMQLDGLLIRCFLFNYDLQDTNLDQLNQQVNSECIHLHLNIINIKNTTNCFSYVWLRYLHHSPQGYTSR